MSDFGAGIALDENWDMRPDESGDVDSDHGIEEIKKDVAILIAEQLRPALGQPMSRDVQVDARIAVEQVLIGDARIDSIRSISITDVGKQEIQVAADVITTEGPYQFVIEVN